MPKFTYKLVNKKDKVIGGSITARSKAQALKKINQDGSTVLFVIPDKDPRLSRKILSLGSGFSTTNKILFFRNLAAMIASNVSVVDALRVFQEQERSKQMKKVITAMVRDIENGAKLSDAMKKNPRYFSEYIIGTVDIGELSGRLVETLDRISEDLQYEYDLKKTVQASLAYPAVVLCSMTVVLITMMVYVLPKIADLFRELDAELPFITKVLISISTFIRMHPFILAGSIMGIFVLLLLSLKTKKGRFIISYMNLRMPVFGSLIKETNLALFFRTLEALFSSGISLVHSIDIAKKTVKNELYKKSLEAIKPILVHGTKLSDALKPFPFLFPLQIQRIVEVGEQSGKLEESFKRLNMYYDRNVRHKTKTLTSLIEPVILIVVGISVGIIALSIFLPIYESVQVF